LTWRHIHQELTGFDFSQVDTENLTLQNWLINMTAYCINDIELPPTEAIHYSLKATSPPLWCYVEQALEQLTPVLRLMVLMAQTFHWSETRIAAYLQAEGEAITPNDVANFLQEGYRMLEDKLPTDIRTIYFGEQMISGATT
jgi:hypothetical protein